MEDETTNFHTVDEVMLQYYNEGGNFPALAIRGSSTGRYPNYIPEIITDGLIVDGMSYLDTGAKKRARKERVRPIGKPSMEEVNEAKRGHPRRLVMIDKLTCKAVPATEEIMGKSCHVFSIRLKYQD